MAVRVEHLLPVFRPAGTGGRCLRKDNPMQLNEAAQAMGRIGGKASGPRKARGNAAYYSAMGKKGAGIKRQKISKTLPA